MKYRSSQPHVSTSNDCELIKVSSQDNAVTPHSYPLESPNCTPQSRQQSQTLSQSFSGLMNNLNGAVQVSVSRSSVVFDGTHTHVAAEEQHFQDGRWSQQSMEGTWTGDQSAEAITQLHRASQSSSRLRSRPKVIRPLPRASKTK
ncbi:MAG: hypothetical protein CMH49_06410 [Myxococcales bacterium]|nr:hypothetical protein [Myxococcales bacterium]